MVICTYGIPMTSRWSSPLRLLSCQVLFVPVAAFNAARCHCLLMPDVHSTAGRALVL